MSTSSLNMLIDLARDQADAAAIELGKANNLRQSEESKLTTLHSYRRNYQEKFDLAIEAGLTASGWQNFHEFMTKLDDAVKQQEHVIAHFQQATDEHRNHWLQQQRKLKVYTTLADRYNKATLHKETVKERRAQDDHAAAFYARAKRHG